MTMLAATYGTRLKVKAEGSDAEEAIEAISELVEQKLFDEPPKAATGDREEIEGKHEAS